MSEIYKDFTPDVIPVISSGHLPSQTALDEIDVYRASYEHGWFVWMDDDLDAEWFVKIREWAKKHNFKWVRFDCGAQDVDELPKFDW